MPLGMELGLSPGDFVLDGHTAPTQKGGVDYTTATLLRHYAITTGAKFFFCAEHQNLKT